VNKDGNEAVRHLCTLQVAIRVSWLQFSIVFQLHESHETVNSPFYLSAIFIINITLLSESIEII